MIKKRQKIKELKISVFVEQMIIETPHLFQSTFYIISEKSRIFFLASRSKNDRFHVERPICIYFFHNISQKKIRMANLPSNIFERMNKLFFNQYTYISLSQI